MIVVDPISVPSPGMLPQPQDASPAFDFEKASRASHSDQQVPLGGVPRALREAAEHSGLDPLAELYNEAIRYAQEGHLRLARERLQMLLCMAPDDGEARLTLARVHVAGQRWKDALAALDEAQNCGISVPMGLRRAVEDHLQSEQASAEEHRAAMRAREQGEVKALRQEARRLRSENAQLTGRVSDLEREVRKWAWSTAGVSTVAIGFLVLSVILGGTSGRADDGVAIAPPTAAPEVAEVTEGAEDAVAAAPVEAPAEAPAAEPTEVQGRGDVASVLRSAEIAGATLAVRMSDTTAVISGEVPTHAERKQAERVVSAVDGVDGVDSSAITVLSRTEGTTHVVESGDTLSHIAYRYYGDSTTTGPIEQANGVTAKGLRVGMELKVPAVE